MGDRVRLEPERPAASSSAICIPAEQRRLALVPGEGRAAVRDARRDEHGGPEAVARRAWAGRARRRRGSRRRSQPDGALRQLAGVQQLGDLDDVERPIPVRGEVVHLLAKTLRSHGELVPRVRDPVVEENPQTGSRRRARASARARPQNERASPRPSRDTGATARPRAGRPRPRSLRGSRERR